MRTAFILLNSVSDVLLAVHSTNPTQTASGSPSNNHHHWRYWYLAALEPVGMGALAGGGTPAGYRGSYSSS